MRAQINLMDEIIVDNFAGGGGASTGMELATGRPVEIAINHDPDAILMHETNHPHTRHYCESVWDINPEKICEGRPVGLAWFSPDCKHFSKAKGGKPVDKSIRGLAWIALRWAGTVRPRVIILENVEEFQTWGPVRRGRPVKAKSGQTFEKFVAQLRSLGYTVEWRELVAADFGAPTTRKRFFLVARCDGCPVAWPEPTHAPRESEAVKAGKLKPWRSAAEIIDWTLPCPSIFASKVEVKERYGVSAVRPLADKTMRRAIRGVDQFVIKSAKPFLVHINHGENENGRGRALSLDEPLPTMTAKLGVGIVNPVLAPVTVTNTTNSVGSSADKPLHTITTAGNQMLISPALTAIGQTGGGDRGRDIRDPAHTTVSKQEDCLLAASLMQYHSEQTERVRGQEVTEPVMTIDAANRYGLIGATLAKYYGNDDHGQDIQEPMHTATAKDREALVAVSLSEFHGNSVGTEVDGPAPATLQKEHQAVQAAFLSKFFGGAYTGAGNEADAPLSTVTAIDHNALGMANLMKLKGQEIGSSLSNPLPTVTAGGQHHAAIVTTVVRVQPGMHLGFWPKVRGLLNQYCDYDIKEDEILLLGIGGVWYFISDIGLRMLTPAELYAANGFPEDYIIDRDFMGNSYGKTKQVARCGNAVPPPFATAIVRVNLPEWCDLTITTMREFREAIAV